MKLIRGVVFDLDGTLLNTANLVTGRRAPWHLLEKSEVDSLVNEFDFKTQFPLGIQQIVGELKSSGMKVSIITRAPSAYASTACYLSNLNFDALLSSHSASDVESRLSRAVIEMGLDFDEVLYMADTEEDSTVAEKLGIKYLRPIWLGREAQLDSYGQINEYSASLRYLCAFIEKESANLNSMSDNSTLLFESVRRFRSEVGFSLFLNRKELELFKVHQLTRIIENRISLIDLLLMPKHQVLGDEIEFNLISHGLPDRNSRFGPDLLEDIDGLIGNCSYYTEEFGDHLDGKLRKLDKYFGDPYDNFVLAYLGKSISSGNQISRELFEDPIVPIFETKLLNDSLIPWNPPLNFEDFAVIDSVGDWLACFLDGALIEHFVKNHFELPVFTNSKIDFYQFMHDYDFRFKVLKVLGRYISFLESEDFFPGNLLIEQYSELKANGLIDLISAVHYRDETGATLWRQLKDWKGAHSGEEVHLSFLNPISIIMAAKLLQYCKNANLHPKDVVIVPVPASPPSKSKPGAVSERLAYQIAQIAQVSFAKILEKSDSNEIRFSDNYLKEGLKSAKLLVLVDDQITKGGTLNRAFSIIRNHFESNPAIECVAMTWSHSRPYSSSVIQSEKRRSFSSILEQRRSVVSSFLENDQIKFFWEISEGSPAWKIDSDRLKTGEWFFQGKINGACKYCSSQDLQIHRKHYVSIRLGVEVNYHYIAIACESCMNAYTLDEEYKKQIGTLLKDLDAEKPILELCRGCLNIPKLTI